MKRFYLHTALILWFTLISLVSDGQLSQHHQVFYLKSGQTELMADPEFGGRIISLKYKDGELLHGGYENPDVSGSTLWPSPQSTWRWPPIDTLDKLPYKVKGYSKNTRFQSMPDKSSGYQISKYFRASEKDSSFLLTYTIKNISSVTRQTGCWEVTRVGAGSIAFFPLASDSGLLKHSTLPGVTVIDSIAWFKYDSSKITKNGKLFGMGKEGWLANIKDGIAFIKVFEDLPSQALAPLHGEIEIYANGNPKYVELENHGRYASLKPGDAIVYKVTWIVRTVPDQLLQAGPSSEWVSWIRKQIKL